MPEYKFTYFGLRGIGEPIRWMFKLTDVPFEDVRVIPETWPQVKNDYDWNQLPFLEIDKKVKLTQSVAIGRYLAKQFDMTPKDDLEAARCDELIDAMNDLRLLWRPYLLEKNSGKNPEKAEELKKQLENEIFPRFFKGFEEILNKTEGDYLLGAKLYWADLFFANFLDIWGEYGLDLDLYPASKKLKEAVFSIPKIQKWVAERPKTFV